MHDLLKPSSPCAATRSLRTDGSDARKPSFTLQRPGTDTQLRFAGLPMGHEFTSLVLALLWTAATRPRSSRRDRADQALDGDFNFEVYMSLTCHNCPDVVQALNADGHAQPRIKTTVIDGGAFQEEVEEREIMAVPTVYLNGSVFGQGRMTSKRSCQAGHRRSPRDAAKLPPRKPSTC
jgi:alkyl hydroperoxide reductase subunit F